MPLNYTGTTHQVAPRGAQRGEPTGEIICPELKGAIAIMRCWERQLGTGCGLSCPLAVKAAEIRRLKRSMRHTAEPGQLGTEIDPLHCVRCGKVKSDPTRALCAECANARTRKRGRYGSLVKYGSCIACRRAKSLNPSPRCALCAAALSHVRRA